MTQTKVSNFSLKKSSPCMFLLLDEILQVLIQNGTPSITCKLSGIYLLAKKEHLTAGYNMKAQSDLSNTFC